jgi:hypothetical protein
MYVSVYIYVEKMYRMFNGLSMAHSGHILKEEEKRRFIIKYFMNYQCLSSMRTTVSSYTYFCI